MQIPYKPHRDCHYSDINREDQSSVGDINISELIAFRVQRLVPQAPGWRAREDDDAEKHFTDDDAGGCESL